MKLYQTLLVYGLSHYTICSLAEPPQTSISLVNFQVWLGMKIVRQCCEIPCSTRTMMEVLPYNTRKSRLVSLATGENHRYALISSGREMLL